MYAQKSHFELPSGLSDSWCRELFSLDSDGSRELDEYFLSDVSRLAKKYLPDEILECLKDLGTPGKPSFCVIRGLPIDEKLDGFCGNDGALQDKVSEGVLLGIPAALGFHVFTFTQEKRSLVHNVMPVLGKETTLSNAGRVELNLHTDHPCLQPSHRPDYLFLLGLVNDGNTPTYIACLEDIMPRLSQEHLDLLMSPNFRFESPDSVHILNGKKVLTEWRALFEETVDGQIVMAGNVYSTRCKNEESLAAFIALKEALSAAKKPIILEPGDGLCFSNLKCFHGRGAVNNQRWLQRVFVKKSLKELQAATNSGPDCREFDVQGLLLHS